ncbi:hypothetical protein BHM03_00006725 [Ensete ventricosum]|nr:hypothetical protein BHM03_00006725 [Ensete ventricosum]
MRNRSVMIDFDCHRLILSSLSRGREKKEDGEEEKERSQLREGERRRERRRGEPNFFSRHAIRCPVSYIMRSIAHGQFLLPAWVEETSPRLGRMNEATSPVLYLYYIIPNGMLYVYCLVPNTVLYQPELGMSVWTDLTILASIHKLLIAGFSLCKAKSDYYLAAYEGFKVSGTPSNNKGWKERFLRKLISCIHLSSKRVVPTLIGLTKSCFV